VIAAFLAKVEAEVRALEKSSGAQDAALTQLPESTRAFCEAKGLLLTKIWTRMLSDVRYAVDYAPGTDGIDYHISHLRQQSEERLKEKADRVWRRLQKRVP
jgi:hypothetical protein